MGSNDAAHGVFDVEHPRYQPNHRKEMTMYATHLTSDKPRVRTKTACGITVSPLTRNSDIKRVTCLRCKGTLQYWRERMLQTPVTTTAADAEELLHQITELKVPEAPKPMLWCDECHSEHESPYHRVASDCPYHPDYVQP